MSFENQEIELKYFFPNLETTVLEPVITTIGEGVEFELTASELYSDNTFDPGYRIDLSSNSIVFTTVETPIETSLYVSAEFNGYVFTDVSGTIPAIEQVTIDEANTTLAIDASDILFAENAIGINLEGISYTPGEQVLLDVEFAATEPDLDLIPEPEPDPEPDESIYEITPPKNYYLGSFGLGRSFIGDVELVADETGNNVSIIDLNTERTFTLESDGNYRGQEDNSDFLLFDDTTGTYTLVDFAGTIIGFNSSGKIDYIEDTNGNRITTAYTDGQLTSLTDSFGNSLNFEYNDDGRITSVTDSGGRTTTYDYDESGELLTTVTDEAGTTTYTYSGSLVESITDPNGTTVEFAYDEQGRLTRQSLLDGEAEAGEVTVTDAQGNETELLLDENDRLSQITDPLGRMIDFGYDNQGNLTQILAPNDNSTSFTYDDRGNLTSQTDAGGNVTEYDKHSLTN